MKRCPICDNVMDDDFCHNCGYFEDCNINLKIRKNERINTKSKRNNPIKK